MYAAVEGEETKLELDPEHLAVLREFELERRFEGQLLLKRGGQGIEAITFVPDPSHPEGGTFYVTNQSFALEDKEEVSALFEVELPLKTKGEEHSRATLLGCFRPGVIDLSGLYALPGAAGKV